jgi:hypothetical protein
MANYHEPTLTWARESKTGSLACTCGLRSDGPLKDLRKQQARHLKGAKVKR